nr:DapH/DapD/GlmU-related protein [Halobiforma nitratireducens]
MPDSSPSQGADPDCGSDTSAGTRHGRVDRHPTPGRRNSLAFWTDAKHPLRVAFNYVFVWLARIAPSLRLRRWFLRRIGVTVAPGVSWGLEATPDVFWPELISLEEDAIVGYDATLLCHEFLQDEYRTGAVVVGKRAMIGAGAIVLPGVEIGADARVAANSLVTRDVPPGTTVAGVPARPMGGDDASDSSNEENTDDQ